MAKIDVKKVARLANLPLSPSEERLYQVQLEEILSYVDRIEEKVKDTKVDPTFNVSTSKNVTANDEVESSLPQNDATANGREEKTGFFLTKGVFDDE